MSFHAANPVGLPHLSPCLVEQANKSFSTCNYGGELRPSYGEHASSNRIAIAVTSAASVQMKTLLWRMSAVMYPVFLLGHSFGAFCGARRHSVFCFALRALGVSVPPKTSLQTTAKYAVQTSFGPLPESRPSALGSRAHSLSSAQCDPSNNGRIQQTETLSCTRTK